ncbi:MAG TPA: hypothetical protein VGG79_19680 [Roseiarcus sp.]|jgi:hypothetical protein
MAGVGRIAPRAMAFALAASAIADPASAQNLTYTFDAGSSFTFSDGDTANLMGSFTINPPGDSLFADDIVITGTGQEAGTYEPQTQGDNILEYVESGTSNDVLLRFGQDLGAASLVLTRVDWAGDGARSTAVDVTGGAQLPAAAPELSTWAMMLIGFAGLGFAATRRKEPLRRTAA